ncbi:MAG TPA: hypothetical protein PLP39_09705 [Flavobacterium lutivivi]|nr:hypothetical protein [Flavobacterium lutivivi]
MFLADNQIADFRDSIYKNGFGFSVSVFRNEDNTLKVQSENLLNETYENFETFLDDLILKNPLWFTYYYVRINQEYKSLVETKLSETIENVFKWLNASIISTHSNWCFEDNGMNNFVQNKIKNEINENFVFAFPNSNNTEIEDEKFELNQMWNGYCPESYLKGKRVRMRLNRNDFYESEETGLQIAVLRGVQAIIMNFRGNGDFRTNPEFADEIENGEMLSPQNTDRPPFNNPTIIFEENKEIENYIKSIK